MVAALLAVLLGGPLGVAAVRRELAGGAAVGPAGVRGRGAPGGAPPAARWWQAPRLRTAFLTPCDPTFGLAFVPAVALPSALAAAALAMLAGTVGAGAPAPPSALYLAGVVASLSATLLEGWTGPPPTCSTLPRHLAGPIYDEALRPRPAAPALPARLAGLDRRDGWGCARSSWPARAPARPVEGRPPVVGLRLLAVAAVRVEGARTGDLATRAGMDRVLGGRRTGARCDLHFPPGEARRRGRAALPRLRGRRRRGGGGPGRGPSTIGEGVGPPVRGGEAASRRRRANRVHQALARRDPGPRRAGGTAGPAPRNRPRGGGRGGGWAARRPGAARRAGGRGARGGAGRGARSRAASGPRTSGPAP